MQRKDRKSKKMVFRVIQIFCICIFFTLWMPDKVHAEKPEKIRVGLYNPEIHYAPGKEITPIGYDYEYLTRIAVHTGWKYEYVTASLDECLDMLQQGKIDLLCGIEKTREREKALSYCDTATMFVSSCLLQSEKEPRYAFEDFESFDGMRIGTVRSSSMIHNLQQYSEENGFSYELLEYGTDEAVKRALDMGEIDAACLESNQNLSRFSVIAYFGYSPRYCVSSPMRPELAQQLDEVLKQIWVEDPKFEYEMFEKYFGYDHNIAFTREEQEYLAEHTEPISVGLYMDIGRLLCRYDEENGEYCGIVVDIMELISESTGLTFRYEEIPEGDTPGNYLRKHPDSIVAPSLINSLISHDSGYLHLNPIIKGRMLTVTRIGEKVDLSGNFRLALPGGT